MVAELGCLKKQIGIRHKVRPERARGRGEDKGHGPAGERQNVLAQTGSSATLNQHLDESCEPDVFMLGTSPRLFRSDFPAMAGGEQG